MFIMLIISSEDALRLHVLGMRPTAESEAAQPISNDEHLLHCFEYVYNAVLCGADATIEWENREGVTDGTGVVHHCANFDALLDWTTRNQSPEHM